MIEAYSVGKWSLKPAEFDPIDPRGLVLVWEQPRRSATYVIGCDPTFGIAGWNRNLRTKDDSRTDNAAIEVFRAGGSEPDVQVAEFAAPIDADSLAEVCNLLGRLYCGSNEDSQALMCIEVYPGTGWQTQRELIQRFGYTNLPPWLVDAGLALKMTNKIGWHSSRSTRQDLWSRGVSHLSRHMAVLRSGYLVDEMADCTPDSFLGMSARARNGLHDDRVVAALIALWFSNEWSLNIDATEPTEKQDLNQPDYQRCDISAGAMVDNWNDRFSSLLGDE